MLAIFRIPWADVIHTFELMLPDRRDRWIRARLEYAFGEPVGVTSRPDFSDPAWIASEYAHILSAVEGVSTLRAAAHLESVAALGHDVSAEESPIAGSPLHCRGTDWSRLGQRLGVRLPPLDVPILPAITAIVVLAGLALLARKFVPRDAPTVAWRILVFMPLLVVWGAARLFGVPPWHLRTQEQLVSHVVIERAAVLPADHRWTLAEIADVVTAVTDLPPGRRPFSVTEFELLAMVAGLVGLLGFSVWSVAKQL